MIQRCLASATGSIVDRVAAHIDLFPTLVEACRVTPLKASWIDGRSLMPLLTGPALNWQDRTLFTQRHPGDVPQLYYNCAARTQRWKLVNGKELYDLDTDPGERNDVAAQNTDIAASLKLQYENWFREMAASRGFRLPPIYIGTPYENPVLLSRQDWRGPNTGYKPESIGYWDVMVPAAAIYEISVVYGPKQADGVVRVRVNGIAAQAVAPEGSSQCSLGRIQVPGGAGCIEAEIEAGGQIAGVGFVMVRLV
jgi:hypothetical protein